MIKQYLIFGFVLLFVKNVIAQTTGTVSINLPVVALMDIEPVGSISLSFQSPIEAGNPVINPLPNTSKWINYSSAISAGGANRKITASINEVISGVNITIQASTCITGAGVKGVPKGTSTILSVAEQEIITGIGGAFTGNGVNFGHQISLGATVDNQTYNTLSRISNKTIVITYTIKE